MGGRARVWLDDDGCFRFGKHDGEIAAVVAKEDPDYIEWVLSETDICDEDYEILEALL